MYLLYWSSQSGNCSQWFCVSGTELNLRVREHEGKTSHLRRLMWLIENDTNSRHTQRQMLGWT